MSDELDLLKQLPRHAPSADLRRSVRVAALDRLAAGRKQPWWRVLWQQAAIPRALAVLSIVYLVRAAADTPLLR